MIRRTWREANEKRDNCRVCGTAYGIELAHVIGRTHDVKPALWSGGGRNGATVHVAPDRVIPLCGPATSSNTCHGIYDGPASQRHKLNLFSVLTLEEQLQAVADAGNIPLAVRRITGRDL